MKRSRHFAILLGIALLISLMAGCATKTKPAEEAVAPPATPSEATDVSRQQPLGVDSQPVQSGPVADLQEVAGLGRIHFAYNQFTLEDAARVTLEKNAIYLRNHATERIVIEGHCDERGSDEYNLALGERRALAAKNYLISLGLPAERLSVLSYGEEKPLVTGANEDAWAQNRRAEFKVAR